MLSRLVITFFPRSKRLLISWLQSPSTVILEPHKIKSDTVSTIKLREQYTDFYFACNPHRCTDSLIISVIHQIFFFFNQVWPYTDTSLLSKVYSEGSVLGVIHTFSSVQFSCSVMSDSLRPHELQHARPSCPSPTPGIHSDLRPSSQWCHPAISSSVVPFSSRPQSLPASQSSPMSQFFTSGSQSMEIQILQEGPWLS